MLVQSSAPARPLSQVVVQGRYEVVRAIGAGAQATVFLSFDLALRQWRALKIAAPGLDDTWHARFTREAQLMARLSHPHVVKIYDVMTLAGTPALVTELARAGSVASWMRRHGPLPPMLAAEVGAPCASALAHAHAHGVLHRDVKPGNVLVHADGGVALADFGIARFTNDAATALTEVGWVLGTLAFMAPEQRRAADDVCHKADIYALGATIFTMCTARRETELFVCADRPSMLDGIPEPLAEVIRACCRYEPGERIGSMNEVRDALLAAARRCPPVPAGSSPLQDGAMALPELPPPPDGADVEVEALRQRLGLTPLSEQETEDHSEHGALAPLPYTMPRRDAREGHVPDPWEDEDPTSLPPYVEKLYPRNLVSMGEHKVVGLTSVEPITSATPAVVRPPPRSRFPVVLLALAMALVVALGAGFAAWHETTRMEAVLTARTDLVDLVIEQRSIVQHLARTGRVAPDALDETRSALDRVTHRRSHLAAAEVAQQIVEHREGIVQAFPDDAQRIRRVQGVLEAWRAAEACRFLCGAAAVLIGRPSDDASRGT